MKASRDDLSDGSNALKDSSGVLLLRLAAYFVSYFLILLGLYSGMNALGLFTSASSVFVFPLFGAFLCLCSMGFLQRSFEKRNFKEAKGGSADRVFLEKILGSFETKSICQALLVHFKNNLSLDAAAVFLKSRDNVYQVAGSFGTSSAAENKLLQSPDLIQSLESLRSCTDLLKQDFQQRLSADQGKLMKQVRAVACLPLFFRDEVLGFVLLGKKRSQKTLTQGELSSLGDNASLIAVAFRNASLFENIQTGQMDYVHQAKVTSLGTLSAGIGHEVKNPLNNIRGAIGMLKLNKKHNVYQGKTRDEVEKEIFDALEIMDQNIARATAVIERLQSFSKNPQDMKVEAMSLQDAVENAIATATQDLRDHGIKLERHFLPDLKPVMAERDALEEILMNLIKNAWQAMDKEGTLTISTLETDLMAEVSVEDTGCGIVPDEIEKIWDPFYTTKATGRFAGSEGQRATGLGLFMVREIVKRFDGKIKVTSIPGKGTKVTILLPFAAVSGRA